MSRTTLSAVLALTCIASGSLAQNSAASDADAERARLEKSLATACKQFDGERQAAALEKCNLAWFRANEKDVWRLNLNPHGRSQASSPSS